MLVVLASRADTSARALCERAPPGTVRVLAWRDLSTPGWRYYGDPADGADTAVVGGDSIPTAAISGVVTRCPSVPPYELGHIVPSDRAYVAAEMTATLLAWLSRLRCPVINPATGMSLCGPRWHPERWVLLAASIGLPVVPLARRAVPGLAPSCPEPGPPPGFDRQTVTVVGRRAIAPARHGQKLPAEQARAALALARAAGLTLVQVHFAVRGAEHRFLAADLNADVAAPPVADALLEHVGLSAGDSSGQGTSVTP